MRREGSRNFGIWNPPTGMDSVRRSTQIDFELIVGSNNPKLGKELGIQQSFGKAIEKIEYSGVSLVAASNNVFEVFDAMIAQGWGGAGFFGHSPPSLPLPPTPAPSLSATSFPSLRAGNLRADQVDRAMKWRVCPSFCVDHYSLRTGHPTIIHRICWQSGRWRSVPPSSTAAASWNTGSVDLESWHGLFDSSVPWNTFNDYFVVDQTTRNSCFPMISSTPLSTLPPDDFDASDVDAVMALW